MNYVDVIIIKFGASLVGGFKNVFFCVGLSSHEKGTVQLFL